MFGIIESQSVPEFIDNTATAFNITAVTTAGEPMTVTETLEELSENVQDTETSNLIDEVNDFFNTIGFGDFSFPWSL